MSTLRVILLTCLCTAAFADDATKVTYYLVEGAMQTAQGRNLPGSVALIKRVVDRAQSKIEESVISLRGSGPIQEFVTLIKPEGNKAKISCTNCDFEGEGEFSGEAWDWSGFKFTTRMGKDGGRVEGEDRFSAAGITVEKRVIGADGRPTVVITETGKVIGQATYDILRTRLLAK